MIATPLTIFSSFVVLGTGLWMYFFSKGKLLEEVHGQLGLAFFIAVVIHLLVNQSAFLKHLKTPKAYVSGLLIALICAIVIAVESGGPAGGDIPPGRIFHQMETAKIADLSRVFQIDVASVVTNLRQDGISGAAEEMTLAQAAQVAGKEPRQMLKYFFTEKGNQGPRR